MRRPESPAARVAVLASLTAVALALSGVERLLPAPLPVPGVKLGLANLATLLALYALGFRAAFVVAAARVLLAGFLFGSVSSIAYAMAGALGSLCMMAACRRVRALGMAGVSVLGGVTHNLAQLGVAALTVRTPGLWGYCPALIASGAATGLLVGLAANAVYERLTKADGRRER